MLFIFELTRGLFTLLLPAANPKTETRPKFEQQQSGDGSFP